MARPDTLTRTILVAGTASHVGKSSVAAGLCRILADRGLSVAPFKAQNMSNNAQVAITPEGTWGEIGVSQFVQARAARVPPTTDMNPVLLKPRGDGESQLVIHGTAVEHVASSAYYQNHWERARSAAVTAYDRLAADHDIVVAEGAGSVAEINLDDYDLANAETARFADAEIIILVDIERGGAFASLYGTLKLAPQVIRERVTGAVITKFRGDRALLDPGIEEIEAKTEVPIVGVLPFDDPGLPAEDSVSLPGETERAVFGNRDGVANNESVTIAVVRLPRISNFTDFDPLARQPGIRVVYVPITGLLGDADAVILPGTKNTVDDLLALRETNFDTTLTSFDGPIVGICGGYQMLGERIMNAGVESTGDHEVVAGLGLLPVVTRFDREKQVERTSVSVTGTGMLSGADGTVTGYEIHMGDSWLTEPLESPLEENSALKGNVLGTYIHGLFENQNVRDAFIRSVAETAGIKHPLGPQSAGSPYDRAARLVASNIDLATLDLEG